MNIGEVWSLDYPYDDEEGGKVRPGLIVLGEDDTGELKCAKITGSLWKTSEDDKNFILIDWVAANLRKESLVELARVEKIHKSQLRKKIGQLTTKDLLTLYSKMV